MMTEKQMKSMKVAEGEAPCFALAQKVEALSAAILAPELDPQVATEARVRAIVGSVRVHASKETQALALIEEAERPILDALRRGNYDALGQHLNRFDRTFRFAGLATPPVEPTQREREQPTLVEWGWGGEESDAAFLYVQPGEKIESVSWDHFIVAGRRIDREKVRLGLKPRWSTYSDSEWLSRFPQMRVAKMILGEVVFTGLGAP